ncbi:MAG: Hsp20/alpha crystallin family protein [Prevotellaceae bacterium]|jgi:HSP20 family protein|nr:Hsp20/alpha crystallin family protein [Prevotellaceae bacterium]
MTPVRSTQNWLPSIFNDFFNNDWMLRANATAPAINVYETDKEYKLELAAPGMTKEDFNVHIDEGNNLVIGMEKKCDCNDCDCKDCDCTDDKKEKKQAGRYLRREFSYTKFQQSMILPEDVDKEKITAQVEHGVLNITLPKFTEQEKAKAQRLIEVK